MAKKYNDIGDSFIDLQLAVLELRKEGRDALANEIKFLIREHVRMSHQVELCDVAGWRRAEYIEGVILSHQQQNGKAEDDGCACSGRCKTLGYCPTYRTVKENAVARFIAEWEKK